MFATNIGRKLEKHFSAIIRKKLLEILRSLLSAASAPVLILLATRLDNVLISLLTDDATADQVLVINLAARVLLTTSVARRDKYTRENCEMQRESERPLRAS